MKYVFILLMLLSFGAVAQEVVAQDSDKPCDHPSNKNNPDCNATDPERLYTIGCSMVDVESGLVRDQFSANHSYTVAGSMYIYFADAKKQWYEDVRAAVEAGGMQLRDFPDYTNPLGNVLTTDD